MHLKKILKTGAVSVLLCFLMLMQAFAAEKIYDNINDEKIYKDILLNEFAANIKEYNDSFDLIYIGNYARSIQQNSYNNNVFKDFYKKPGNDYYALSLRGVIYRQNLLPFEYLAHANPIPIASVNYSIKWRESYYETLNVISFCKEKCKEFINKSSSDYEKIAGIHDYMVKEYKHVQSRRPGTTAFRLIESKKGDSMAFTMLTYQFLTAAGIENKIIYEGPGNEKSKIMISQKDSGEHYWNIVRLEGKWYHMDTAPDAPENAEPTKEFFLKGNTMMKKSYMEHSFL